jgi:hypothetical protein
VSRIFACRWFRFILIYGLAASDAFGMAARARFAGGAFQLSTGGTTELILDFDLTSTGRVRALHQSL